MTQWIITGVAVLTTALLSAYAGAWYMHRKDEAAFVVYEEEITAQKNVRIETEQANERLRAENAEYHQRLNDAQAILGKAQLKTLEQEKEIASVRQQLADLEARPAQPEAVYAVKKPRKSPMAVRRDTTAGEDGEK